MGKAKWLYHRLKSMSASEVAHRVKEKYKKKQYIQKYASSISILEADTITINDVSEFEKRLAEVFSDIKLNKLNFNSEIKIYNKNYNIFEKIDWHLCTNGKWPNDIFSLNISFKEQESIGDVRFTWEINRHLFFPQLALRYRDLKEQKILDVLKNHFYDWISQNPFLKGVNWSSPMEIAIRAYQWTITLAILKDIKDIQLKNDICKAIINSIKYVEDNLSKFSSANNHLIVEAIITSIIGYCVEPIYENNWFNEGYKIIEQQIPLQVYEDGVNKEQALHYHSFVTDIILQYNFILKRIYKKPLYEELAYKMVEFIGMIGQGAQYTEFGDSDDAKIIDLDGNKINYYDYVLQLASMYYGERFYKYETLFPEVMFISGKDDALFKVHNYPSLKVYKDGGYIVLKEKDIFLLFDFGLLGFGTIAAHGHADALSFVLHFGNKPIFIDPGTYIYNIEKEWRDYFRKTSSHNTLYYDNLDQSTIQGPFLWSKKANSRLLDIEEDEDIICMSAQQDGYKPNIHKRAIKIVKKEEIIIIEDEFTGNGKLNFVFNNEIIYCKLDDKSLKVYGEQEIYIYFSKSYKIIEKWISKSFLEKVKTTAINIENNFDIYPKVYTIISSKPLQIKDNSLSVEGKTYRY